MSFQYSNLRRGIDVYTNIGAHAHTKELILAHAKYCGSAIYLPPTQVFEIQSCIDYLEMLRTYATECKDKFYPFISYPVVPNSATDQFKLRETLEKGKAKGVVAIVCRLRDWDPEFYLALARSQASGELSQAEFTVNISRLHTVFEIAKQLQMPLLLDAGFPAHDQDPIVNWERNGAIALKQIYRLHPKLRCVVLHVTTSDMVGVIHELSDAGNINGGRDIYGAITPQHLFMCDLGIGLRKYPENPVPMPLPQTKDERQMLRKVVASSKRIMKNFVFSTDSSCALRGCVCGGWCGAVTSIPHAISLMLEGFEYFPADPELDGFMIKNAARMFPSIKLPDGNFEVESEIVRNPSENRALGEFTKERTSFTGLKCLWHLR